MKIAAYCRVSTDKEDQLNSLETQKTFFSEYARKNGHELVGLYADEGISGTKTKNRKAFLRLMEEADEEIRNKIIEMLAERGVSTNVHYKPLPMMTAYKELSGGIEKYPNAYGYYQNLITLPLHTLLSDEDVEYVCECLKSVVRELYRENGIYVKEMGRSPGFYENRRCSSLLGNTVEETWTAEDQTFV